MKTNEAILRVKSLRIEAGYSYFDIYFLDKDGRKILRLPSLPSLRDGDVANIEFDRELEYILEPLKT